MPCYSTVPRSRNCLNRAVKFAKAPSSLGIRPPGSSNGGKNFAAIDSLKRHATLVRKTDTPYYALNKHLVLMGCDKGPCEIDGYSWQHQQRAQPAVPEDAMLRLCNTRLEPGDAC